VKQQIDRLNATPSKRLFLSIIADYDLNRSICELVDNALDMWVRSGRARRIIIDITLDEGQQTITIADNAGGLARHELSYVVAPGQTGTSPTDETIGIFGVGSKRAVVALAQEVRIRTRHLKARETYQIDFNEEWTQDEDWELPLYQVADIPPGTTVVDLHRLRIPITAEAIAQAKEHLGTTYARFLANQKVTIKLNGKPVTPQFFDSWSYPPSYGPKRYTGTVKSEDDREVRIEVVAGLASESSPAAGEYGVYFYCNDRLIARGVKTYDVGFMRGFAGLPHPKVSLVRVLVFLSGDARAMPWNSSKSDINTRHPIFRAIREWLVQVLKDYAALSRIWMGEWPEKVFKYKTGDIDDITISDFPTAAKSYLPALPKSRPRYGEIIAQKNRSVAHRKPWVRGLYEGVIAADLIFKQHLDQKNRIALIVLDSTLEIAFKEYLVNDSGGTYGDKQLIDLFKNRASVQKEIQKYVSIAPTIWKKVDHYYLLRCKFIHERATVGISDAQLRDFRGVVETVLNKLYKLKFEKEA
jgi:hypothetical protein